MDSMDIRIPHSRNSRRPQSGFTMAELLVAIFLGLIILGIVAYCFSNTQRAANRAMALLSTHNKARIAMEMIKRDLEAMHPGCAINIPDATGKEVTFMTAVATPLNADGDAGTSLSGWPYHGGEDLSYNLAWVKYSFNAPAWAANTFYAAGDYVTKGGRLYKCRKDGESAAAGPSGTDIGKVEDDGSTQWECRPNTDPVGLRRGITNLETTVVGGADDNLKAPDAASAVNKVPDSRMATILTGVSGSIKFYKADLSTQVSASVVGLGLDGSGVAGNRPVYATISLHIASKDVGASGDTVGDSFDETVRIPGETE